MWEESTDLGEPNEHTKLYRRSRTLRYQPALRLYRRSRREEVRFYRWAAAVPASGTVVRRRRSLLLSGPAVHGAARRARHLRAGHLPLFAMHPRPAILLSTPRFWRSLLYPALYAASIMFFMNSLREAQKAGAS